MICILYSKTLDGEKFPFHPETGIAILSSETALWIADTNTVWSRNTLVQIIPKLYINVILKSESFVTQITHVVAKSQTEIFQSTKTLTLYEWAGATAPF